MSEKRCGTKAKSPQNRAKLLQSITRDRNLLNAYFQDLESRESQSASTHIAVSKEAPMQSQQRDSYDLFFESACISIKSLPPKLAAEAKSRISQIITEFEIRAISEQEARLENEKEKQQLVSRTAVRVANDPLGNTSSGIVYEFQPYT